MSRYCLGDAQRYVPSFQICLIGAEVCTRAQVPKRISISSASQFSESLLIFSGI